MYTDKSHYPGKGRVSFPLTETRGCGQLRTGRQATRARRALVPALQHPAVALAVQQDSESAALFSTFLTGIHSLAKKREKENRKEKESGEGKVGGEAGSPRRDRGSSAFRSPLRWWWGSGTGPGQLLPRQNGRLAAAWRETGCRVIRHPSSPGEGSGCLRPDLDGSTVIRGTPFHPQTHLREALGRHKALGPPPAHKASESRALCCIPKTPAPGKAEAGGWQICSPALAT